MRSGDRLEFGTAKLGQFVENVDGNPDFRLLVLKSPCFQFWLDDTCPTTHLGFRTTALIVTVAGLPAQAAVGLYRDNLAVAKRWIMRQFRAMDGALRRRDDDLYSAVEACVEQIAGWCAVIGTVHEKARNRRVDLIQ